ncbi:MAG TPA: hypothetical protein P5155_01865 [Candidatus Absconditabacterales bacterium]|nr:hypothetical protein [Candidatus Absconditabacterales bacterium]
MKKRVKRLIGVVIAFSLVVVGVITLNYYPKKTATLSDAQKFARDYTQVDEDNLFVYKSAEEAVRILENGFGIVFFGFPSCKRCQYYVPHLQKVAEQEGIEKIYYVDIKEDRAENSESYQQIVAFLGEYLLFDNEGNPRVYVPDVTIVSDGKVLFHDNESSVVTEEDGTPEEYWTSERVSALEGRLADGIKLLPRLCSDGCNE